MTCRSKRASSKSLRGIDSAPGTVCACNGANALRARSVVEAMARNLDCTVADLMTSRDLRERIVPGDYVTGTVGLPTLQDILSELAKPGRDPRAGFSAVTFADNVTRMEDLNPGMVYLKASGLQDATALHAALSGFQAIGEQKNEPVDAETLMERVRAVLKHNPSVGGHFAVCVPDLDVVVANLEEMAVPYSDAGSIAMDGFRQVFCFDPAMNLVEFNGPV